MKKNEYKTERKELIQYLKPNKKTRKRIINHFIKFFIYDLKRGIDSEVYIEDVEYDLNRFLEPYIKDNHYNFSPFEEIKGEEE